MPFPLAHPVAVLPLRRFGPRWRSFPALVVGSVMPDFGYLFGRWHLARLSHRFLFGGLAFCVPVGAILFYLLWIARYRLVRLVPSGHRDALLTLCQQSRPGALTVGLSLLLGSWTHVFLDALTHRDGWIVQHIPPLQRWVQLSGARPLAVCDLVYYALTFFGVAWLAGSYLRWAEAAVPGATAGCRARKALCSLGVAAAMLLVSAAGRDPYLRTGDLFSALATLLLVLAFLWVTDAPLRRRRIASSQAKPGRAS